MQYQTVSALCNVFDKCCAVFDGDPDKIAIEGVESIEGNLKILLSWDSSNKLKESVNTQLKMENVEIWSRGTHNSTNSLLALKVALMRSTSGFGNTGNLHICREELIITG